MVLSHLKEKGVSTISFDKLDKYMRNAGLPQFSYDTFKSAYTDPRIKGLVDRFDSKEITLKGSSVDNLDQTQQDGNAVGQMAQRATDLGASL